MKILIVDDNKTILRLLHAQITLAGYDVIEAANGNEAWDLVQSTSIPLIITDWMMPGMDGLELIRRIRSSDMPAYTYIILLTARGEPDDIVNGLDAGADDYLIKPFDARELRARIAIGIRIVSLESRLRETLRELQRLATYDSLTGLMNRRVIYEHAEAEVARVTRDGVPVSLVLLDIDHFKHINDTYGHPVGDQVLQIIAATIAQSIRPYDRAGRWGGEEFLLVLPNTSRDEAEKVAERIRANVAALRLTVEVQADLEFQVSLGVVSIDSGSPHAVDVLISHADKALYQAKKQGRNRVCIFSPPDS